MKELPAVTHKILPRYLDACIQAKHPAIVVGEPGIGKTEGWQQAAARHGMKMETVHLNQLGPGDVHGHRFPDTETGTSMQFPPDFLPTPDDPPTLVLFDELMSAPELTRKPALELFLHGRLGKYVLDDRHTIGAASNSGEDGTVTFRMDRATADRFCAFHLVPDLKQWIRDYAIPSKVDARVISHLRSHPRRFAASGDPENENVIVPTPRAWTITSRLLQAWEARNPASTPEQAREIMQAAAPIISGKVGREAADEFITFANAAWLENSVETLLNAPRGNRSHLFPQTSEGLFRVCAAIPSTIDTDRGRTMRSAIDALALSHELASHTPAAGSTIIPSRDAAAWSINTVLTEVNRIVPDADLSDLHDDPDANAALSLTGISQNTPESLGDTLTSALASY